MKCYHCGSALSRGDEAQWSRRDTCSHCHQDVRICKNCSYYDESTYNECTESQAERVLDKEKANFCDWFRPSIVKAGKSKETGDDSRQSAESLFKKK